MAGRNRPSFLKKQKEEQRRSRATKKREERRARKQAPLLNDPDPTETEGVPDMDGDPTDDERL